MVLFYFAQGTLMTHYPARLGRPDWPTPAGTFAVLSKQENPVWDVRKSIQEEMRRCGQTVKTRVPHPDDIADLFGRVSIGTPGHIIYTPVLLARLRMIRST